MAPPAFNFNVFMEKEKLAINGSNFTNWFMNLRFFLNVAQKQYGLDGPIVDAPTNTTSQFERNVYDTKHDDYTIVKYAILFSLEPGLQELFEISSTDAMVEELKSMFESQIHAEIYMISREFFSVKMKEHSSVTI